MRGKGNSVLQTDVVVTSENYVYAKLMYFHATPNVRQINKRCQKLRPF